MCRYTMVPHLYTVGFMYKRHHGVAEKAYELGT